MIELEGLIRPGDGVWWGQGAAEPAVIVNALLDGVAEIGPIRAFSGMSWNERFLSDIPDEMSMLSYGALGRLRHLSSIGKLEIFPCNYSALPQMFADRFLPTDVGLVQVSPPDSAGNVSLGIGVDYVADAIPHTRTLVAEVNQRMPKTQGGPVMHLSEFARIINTDRPLLAAPPVIPSSIDRKIGANVASLIEDRATIQVGVGSLIDAVLDALVDHADLGAHSGIVQEPVLSLIEKGVVTGAYKEMDAGLAVTGSLHVSGQMISHISETLEFRPTSYTHDRGVLSKFKSLVAVNSALEVDLHGQVAAETVGGRHVGAVGGHADFCSAASATGAMSIVAMRATVGNGEAPRSTIVSSLSDGLVTTSRANVDVVVTEYGIAMLKGASSRERTRRLIEVAAPEFRDPLRRHVAEGGHRSIARTSLLGLV